MYISRYLVVGKLNYENWFQLIMINIINHNISFISSDNVFFIRFLPYNLYAGEFKLVGHKQSLRLT